MIPGLFAVLLLFVVPTFAAAPPAQPWEQLDGCRLIPNRRNDGDSCHVQAGSYARVFRLYFVDTPEAEAEYADLIKEQADYFGITPAEAVKLGEQAATFTKSALAAGFTVQTRWQIAFERSPEQRFYAFVYVGKTDLAELLVSKGLARIYGTRTPLPDGQDSRAYVAHLARVESAAKAARLGGWKGRAAGGAPVAAPANSTANPAGTDVNQTFKKCQ